MDVEGRELTLCSSHKRLLSVQALERGQLIVGRESDENVERAFAHLLETGGVRRVHVRRHKSIQKRMLFHAAAFKLGLASAWHSARPAGPPRGASGTRWPRQHRHLACLPPRSPPMGLSRAENPAPHPVKAPSCTPPPRLDASCFAPRLFAGKPILPRTARARGEGVMNSSTVTFTSIGLASGAAINQAASRH